MKLPKNWNDVTIEQFQALHKLDKKDPYMANITTLAILAGKTIDAIEDMRRGKVIEALASLEWMRTLPESKHSYPFRKGNHIYYFVTHPNEMTGGDYTDITHFSGDAIENLHNICAKLTTHYTVVPKRLVTKDFAERAELFRKTMPFSMAHSYMLFFSACYPALQKVSLSYLEGVNQAITDHPIHLLGSD